MRLAPGHVSAVRATVFDRLTPEQTARVGEISRIIAEGPHQPEDADLPWLR